MNAIPHILSPLSAAWSGWTMLGLLLCAVLSEVMQPGVIMQAGSSLLTRAERTYKDAPTNFFGQLLITLFRIGTLAMGLYLCLYRGGNAPYWVFAAISGLILAMLLLKMLCNVLLDYTFQLSRLYAPAYEQYGNLLTLTMVVLYPCLLFLLRVGSIVAARWTVGLLLVAFGLLWFVRCIRIFASSLVAIGYILLYFLTLEVLPMAGLFLLTQKILFTL